MSLRPLLIEMSDLWRDANKSSLKTSVASGSNTLTVYSTADFAVNKILLIGEFGSEGSEIIKTHGTTAPTGFTITLASNTVKAHAKDTPVYIIPYNQIEISHADTETGEKTVLSLQTINPENPEIRYDDAVSSKGYYFTRYKETINNTFSDYSAPMPFEGYAINSVGYLIYGVLDELGKSLSERLSHDLLIRKINAGLSFIKGKLKRWSNYQEFDYKLAQINRGQFKFALPASYYDKNSNKSCLSVRIGNKKPLVFRDRLEFLSALKDVGHSNVASTLTAGGTALVLDSTADFASTGTVNVYISNTLYTLTYSANNTTTNTLTIGAIAVDIPKGTDVWFNESEGEPSQFSIWDGYLYIWSLADSTVAGKNIYMDFYTDIVRVDSDDDILSPARYDMLEYWLKWEIRNITENNGKRDFNDGDYLMFLTTLTDAVRRESSGQKFKMSPKINGIDYGTENNLDFDKS